MNVPERRSGPPRGRPSTDKDPAEVTETSLQADNDPATVLAALVDQARALVGSIGDQAERDAHMYDRGWRDALRLLARCPYCGSDVR